VRGLVTESRVRIAVALVLAAGLLGFDAPAVSSRVAIPLNCSRGPSRQEHHVAISAPAVVAPGSKYKVRVDGLDSGKVSHMGLNYIFGMWEEWPVPPGTRFVEGSAHVLPGTGSANVREGARLGQRVVGGATQSISLVSPARVQNGESYTPPSLEFELEVTAPAGASIVQQYAGFNVTANAIFMGDLVTTCTPDPKTFALAVTKVEAP
jgi:hypothetical protein